MPWKNGNPPLYHVWRGMLDRCYCPTIKQYKDYGGRGISVCEQWKNSYSQWFTDMGPRPEGSTLDRKDNNGNYEPNNCRWATRKQQQRNQRVTRKVVIAGHTYVAADLADKAGVKTDIIMERVKRGLSLSEVLSNDRFHNLEGLKLGAKISAQRRREKTHCKRGHKFTPENTEWGGSTNYRWRSCKRCRTEARWKRFGINKTLD